VFTSEFSGNETKGRQPKRSVGIKIILGYRESREAREWKLAITSYKNAVREDRVLRNS
jgi:hypothetical protein